MKSLFIISLALFLFAFRTDKSVSCLKIDILLVGDFSASVKNQEHFVASAFTEFANQFELSEESTKIGVISFANDGKLLCALTSDTDSLKTALHNMRRIVASGTTNLQEGLEIAFKEMHGKNSRFGYKKMVIVVSDGYPDRPTEVLALSEQLKATGIMFCTILITQSSTNPDFMKQLSNNCYVESDYKNLVNELKKLDICI